MPYVPKRSAKFSAPSKFSILNVSIIKSYAIATLMGVFIVNANAQLPNAYELVEKLNSQQAQIARLTGNVEQLQLQIDDLNTIMAQQAAVNDQNLETLNNTLQRYLDQRLLPQLQTQISKQIKVEIAKASAANAQTAPQPYLAPSSKSTTVADAVATANANLKAVDEPKHEQSTGQSITQVDKDKQGKQAYRAAYDAFKEEGAQQAVDQMQLFINENPDHVLIPRAHYWLGEFYLQLEPPNVEQAKKQFTAVVTTFNTVEGNDKQSKALYRLANLASNNGESAKAKSYAEQLIKTYPDSREADLAKKVDW